jgi:hypothetical protein
MGKMKLPIGQEEVFGDPEKYKDQQFVKNDSI